MRLKGVTISVCSVLLAILVACSNDKPSNGDHDAAFDRLEADIVIKAYEDGRLGSAEEIKADMEPFFERLDAPKPIDASGRFVSYDEMTDRQKMAFQGWHRSSARVLNVVGPEILRAEQERLKDLDRKG